MDAYLNTFRKLLDEMPPDTDDGQLEQTDAERYDAMTPKQKIAVQREVLSGFRNVPSRYATATLDNWTMPTQTHRNMLASIRRYVAQANAKRTFSTGLILHGNFGCGKTHLAVAVAKAISRPSRCAIFIDMPDLAAELQKEYDDAEGDDKFCGDIIGELKKSPIVVIDDLGTERLTPDIANKLGQVIHLRYNVRGTLTIFTSNLVWPHEFVGRYGEGNASRIGEDCAAYRLPDYDFRGVR